MVDSKLLSGFTIIKSERSNSTTVGLESLERLQNKLEDENFIERFNSGKIHLQPKAET